MVLVNWMRLHAWARLKFTMKLSPKKHNPSSADKCENSLRSKGQTSEWANNKHGRLCRRTLKFTSLCTSELPCLWKMTLLCSWIMFTCHIYSNRRSATCFYCTEVIEHSWGLLVDVQSVGLWRWRSGHSSCLMLQASVDVFISQGVELQEGYVFSVVYTTRLKYVRFKPFSHERRRTEIFWRSRQTDWSSYQWMKFGKSLSGPIFE